MSNRAAAIRAAVQARHPGAVVEARGEGWIRHALPDGRRALSLTVAPLHYAESGWQEIDTTPTDSDDAAYDNEVARTPYRVRVKGGNRRFWPRRDVADEWIDLGRPEFQRPNGRYADIPWDGRRREDNAVVFYRSDAELRVSFSGARLKLDMVLLSQPSSTRWRFPVSITGLTRQGGNLVSDRDRTVVARVAPFTLVDAAGVERDVAGTFTNHPTYQGAYVIQPDLSDLTYPVTIDPTLTIDVATGADDGAWGGAGFSSSGSLIYFGDASGVGQNAYFRFTGASGASGQTIDVAELRFVAGDTLSGTTVNLTISAEATNNASAPTTAADANGRSITTATVAWNNVAAWTGLDAITTPSLVSIVQELADSYLTAGVALFFVKNNGSSTNARRAVAASEIGSPYQPELYIEYSAGGGQSISLGHIANSSTVNGLTFDKATSLGHIANTATLPALDTSKAVALAHITDGDTVNGLDHQKVVALGHLANSNTANGLTFDKRVRLGHVANTSTVHALTAERTAELDHISNASTVNGFTFDKAIDLGHITNASTVNGLDHGKTVALGHITYSDTVNGLNHAKSVTLGHISDGDTVNGLTFDKAIDLDHIDSTSGAHSLFIPTGEPLPHIANSSTVYGFTFDKAIALDHIASIATAHTPTAGVAVTGGLGRVRVVYAPNINPRVAATPNVRPMLVSAPDIRIAATTPDIDVHATTPDIIVQRR